ncbi:T9SS type A sorting domain-containing protein [Aequorivita viscosa]|nr:T9SS type A sorting domain-containing protein [Aequorivita viscosa]
MKYILLTIIVFSNINGYCQFGSQQIISTTANYPVNVYAADIDGDGKNDILSAARVDNNIAWYKNIDGNGNFGSLDLIAFLDEAKSVFAADLDGDNDLDVLATSSSLNLVVWYENLDGQGNFSTQKVISNQAVGAFSAIAADIDGDGDMDLAVAYDVDGLLWFENVDGQGDFSGRVIDNTIAGARSVVAVDMDGDGDLDVLGNGTGSNKIFWIENIDGIGTFGTLHIINDVGSYSNVIFAADVDGDGDMDVFSASPGDNEVAWYENLDGMGNFGPKNSITNTLDSTWTVYAEDLDNDGDIDVLATSVEVFGGEIVWFENMDGTGDFSAKKIISTEVQFPRSVIAADIDNDGDMDVISSSQNDDKIAWYENFTILGVGENEIDTFKIYPNPTKDVLNIKRQAGIVSTSIILYDTFGRILFETEYELLQINLSNYNSGIYYLKLKTIFSEQIMKVIKK